MALVLVGKYMKKGESKMNDKIDFVIIWVDGNDKEWQKEKNKYNPDKKTDTREIRYRDWDNLKYWFRGVEKFAPWVNKIHFVTWGHLPKWLNTNNPKLNIVNHKDYIPKKYLPTFNANVIELNLHRIKGLKENFVYFNDDMFIIKKTKETDFFKNNLPCDTAILNANISDRENQIHVDVADMDIINSYFKKNEVIKKNFTKWFNLKYGKQLIRTFCLMPWNEFPGIWNAHLANSYKKSTFKELWEKEYDILDETSSHKFRYVLDVNQWLMQDWQIAKGNFVPRKASFGASYALCNDDDYNQKVFNKIKKQKLKMICVNDMVSKENYERVKNELIEAFETILPEKSSFEK